MNLPKKIKDYCHLCDLCGEDKKEGIDAFKAQLHKVLLQLINQEDSNIFNLKVFSFILEKGEVLDIVEYELLEAKKLMVQHWIDQLIKNNYTEQEYRISKKLLEYSLIEEYKELIESQYTDLLCEKIFPIKARNDIQYYTCINVLKILHNLNADKLEIYYQELMKKKFDSMAKYRCKCAMNHLKEW